MKINDLLKENNVTEAPLGAFATAGNTIRSMLPGKSGRNIAQGKLQAGDVANKLYSEFYRTMASQGKEKDFTADDIEQFLQSKNYPTAKALDVLKGAGGAGPSATPAASNTPPAANATTPTAAANTPPANTATPSAANATTPPAGNNRIDPTMDPVDNTTAQPAAPDADTDDSKAGTSAFSNMAGNLDKMGDKPDVTTSAPGTKGGLGPQGRETLSRLGRQKQDRENPGQGSLPLGEALDKNIVAKAFSAAAGENNALIMAQKQSKNLPNYFPQTGQSGTTQNAQPASGTTNSQASTGLGNTTQNTQASTGSSGGGSGGTSTNSKGSVTPDVIKDILQRLTNLEKRK
jgi:hypothetical protein